MGKGLGVGVGVGLWLDVAIMCCKIAVVDTPAVVVGIGFAAAVILVVLGGDG